MICRGAFVAAEVKLNCIDFYRRLTTAFVDYINWEREKKK